MNSGQQIFQAIPGTSDGTDFEMVPLDAEVDLGPFVYPSFLGEALGDSEPQAITPLPNSRDHGTSRKKPYIQ
jgi:hypothetical protein